MKISKNVNYRKIIASFSNPGMKKIRLPLEITKKWLTKNEKSSSNKLYRTKSKVLSFVAREVASSKVVPNLGQPLPTFKMLNRIGLSKPRRKSSTIRKKARRNAIKPRFSITIRIF